MYEKLLKALRVEPFEVESVGLAKVMNEAADAIEELAAFKAQLTDGRFYVYKLGTLFELKRDPRELIVRHQAPSKEADNG